MPNTQSILNCPGAKAGWSPLSSRATVSVNVSGVSLVTCFTRHGDGIITSSWATAAVIFVPSKRPVIETAWIPAAGRRFLRSVLETHSRDRGSLHISCAGTSLRVRLHACPGAHANETSSDEEAAATTNRAHRLRQVWQPRWACVGAQKSPARRYPAGPGRKYSRCRL